MALSAGISFITSSASPQKSISACHFLSTVRISIWDEMFSPPSRNRTLGPEIVRIPVAAPQRIAKAESEYHAIG